MTRTVGELHAAGAIMRSVGGVLRTRLGRSLATGGIMGGGITLLLMGVQHLAALPMFVTSWASSAALILWAPRSRAAQPRVVVIAHVLCGAIGLAVGATIAHPPSAIVVAFALGVVLMLQLRIMHPPAAANPIIALTVAAPHVPLMMGWIGGGLCLAALALIMRTVGGEGDPPG